MMLSDPLQHGQIQFFDSAIPPLPTGSYKITATQQVVGDAPPSGNNTFIHEQGFEVAGPRFALNPGDVYAFYPPANSQGEFETTFPHIVLARRTLPWERNVGGTGTLATPWMALLLFDEDELRVTDKPHGETLAYTLPVRQIINPETEDVRGPIITDPTLDEQDMSCLVIDVKAPAFQAIAPACDELAYLAHVRQVNTEHKEILGLDHDGWFSVVMCNRLPNPTGRSIVHLVSLEGLIDYLPHSSGESKLKDFSWVRLVSLASWSFICVKSAGTFKHLMTNVAKNSGLLRMPSGSPDNSRLILSFEATPTSIQSGEGVTLSWQTTGDCVCLLDPDSDATPLPANTRNYRVMPNETTTYTLTATDQDGHVAQSRVTVLVDPNQGQQLVSDALTNGYVPIDYLTRQGETSVGWYRGPLVPFATGYNPPQDIYRNADQTLVYDPDTGLFDLSFAVAWQIGRLLALADGGFSLALMNWRRKNYQQINLLDEQKTLFHNYGEILGAPQVSAETTENNLPRGLVANFLKNRLGPVIAPANSSAEPLIRAGSLPGLLSPQEIAELLASPSDPTYLLNTRLFGHSEKGGES
jgi:hypothetical protein